MSHLKRQGGMALILVTILVLLLASAIAAFARRATVDHLVSRNRNDARQAEALGRGGIQLAIALLVQDRLSEAVSGEAFDSREDIWSRVGEMPIPAGDDANLTLEIRDQGGRFNLNALFAEGEPADEKTELFLTAFLEKVIDDLPGDASDKLEWDYDPKELAGNLIDFVDSNEDAHDGGFEDDVYQRQDPPYRASNLGAFLSPEELRLVEGFDARLIEAMLPYLTVYPYANGAGVNVNTAPDWILALIYHEVAGEYRLADEQLVADILEVRREGMLLCEGAAGGNSGDNPNDPPSGPANCRALSELIPGEVYPPLQFTSEVFTVVAHAQVGEVQRHVEAVVDRTNLGEPAILAWRIH